MTSRLLRTTIAAIAIAGVATLAACSPSAETPINLQMTKTSPPILVMHQNRPSPYGIKRFEVAKMSRLKR